MVVTVVLTPVLPKAKKCRFYQEIGGCYKGTIILKNSVPIRSIPFKCIFVRLEKALMRGKKKNAKFHWHYISDWSIEHISVSNINKHLAFERAFLLTISLVSEVRGLAKPNWFSSIMPWMMLGIMVTSRLIITGL